MHPSLFFPLTTTTLFGVEHHRVSIPVEVVDHRHVNDLKDLPQWGHAFQTGFIFVDWMENLRDEYGELRGDAGVNIFIEDWPAETRAGDSDTRRTVTPPPLQLCAESWCTARCTSWVYKCTMCSLGQKGHAGMQEKDWRCARLCIGNERQRELICLSNAHAHANFPRWFHWSTIQVVQCSTSQRRPGLRHMKVPSPLSAICVVGAHSGGEFCVESGGVLHSPMQGTPMRLDVHGGGVVEAGTRF